MKLRRIQMNKSALIIMVAIVAVSGCVSSNGDVNPQNNSEDVDNRQNTDSPSDGGESLLGDDSVTTFTRGGENMTMKLTVDNSTETYDFTIEQSQNVTGNEYFSRYASVNLSARVMCGLTQQIAYNYSNLSSETGGDSSGLRGDSELSEGLGSSEEDGDSELPSWPFEMFEADEVEYTLTDKGTSQVLASCKPTREEEANIEINIEQETDTETTDSENSEGLS
jgi:hypothetical protein